MNRYENMNCPVCGEKLSEEDIVVCPECGAPHHRDCYAKIGHCFYENTHGTPEQFQPPEIEYNTETKVEQKCSNCGFPIGDDDNVCKKCGKPVGEENAPNFSAAASAENETQENQSQSIAENPFFVNNGLNKDEEIEGEKLSDIACFIGYNALRYIKVFKRMALSGKKTSWNWLAFFFPEYWLISRKCYTQGIFMGFFSVLMTVISSISSQTLLNMMGAVSVDEMYASPTFIGFTIIAIIDIIVRAAVGLFGDYIYKNKVISSLRMLKKAGATDEMTLMSVGGVNLFLIGIMYLAVYFLATVVIQII